MKATSFNPPQRTLMGPGPSDVHPRVLKAMSQATVGHLDPVFVELMDDVKRLLRYAFQTENSVTFPLSAPGSSGMEACFFNLVEPGDTVVVCRNGVFGERMREVATRAGAEVVVVDDPWGEPVSADKLEQALKEKPKASLVGMVHAETSTGARSDVEKLAGIAHANDCLVIVDAVTSLAGNPLKVDEWGLDAVYSGSQKCLSCVPGLSPVTFGERAIDKVKSKNHPSPSWFLDSQLMLGYWEGSGKRTYHHTAPVNSIYALHESLVMLAEEGIEVAWQRHRDMHGALAAGLEVLGLEFLVSQQARLPQLNAVKLPQGFDDAGARKQLLQDYQLEVGAGLGKFAGSVWRIGLMGSSACLQNVETCLGAFESMFDKKGAVEAAKKFAQS